MLTSFLFADGEKPTQHTIRQTVNATNVSSRMRFTVDGGYAVYGTTVAGLASDVCAVVLKRNTDGTYSQDSVLTWGDITYANKETINFPRNVCISSDGNVLFVGSPTAVVSGVTTRGVIYRFVRNGATWQ